MDEFPQIGWTSNKDWSESKVSLYPKKQGNCRCITVSLRRYIPLPWRIGIYWPLWQSWNKNVLKRGYASITASFVCKFGSTLKTGRKFNRHWNLSFLLQWKCVLQHCRIYMKMWNQSQPPLKQNAFVCICAWWS